jgi:hypothetical protein
LFLKLIPDSAECKVYSDTEVPEQYQKTLQELEKGIVAKAEEEQRYIMSPAERRELEERVVANTYKQRRFAYNSQYESTFKRQKIEPKYQEIKDFKGSLFYGYQIDETKLQYAAHILTPQIIGNEMYTNAVGLVSISKSNKKHFSEHIHINDFFGKEELYKVDGKIKGVKMTVDNRVVLWNTARQIHEKMGDLSFFFNFHIFDSEMTALYDELKAYKNSHYNDVFRYENRVGVKEHHKTFLGFLDTLQEFQSVLENDENDAETIAEKAKELAKVNVSDNTRKVVVVDTEMLEKLDTLLAYANPIKVLLNSIPVLTGNDDGRRFRNEIPFELQMEIKAYLGLKS